MMFFKFPEQTVGGFVQKLSDVKFSKNRNSYDFQELLKLKLLFITLKLLKMNKIKKTTIVLFTFLICLVLNGQAQTAGTFTFKINPVSHSGNYGLKHVVAIWIENSAGTFVKTKLRQSSGSTIDHLATWTTKSASNVVDATTGATLTSYSALTVTWNGTNVSKVVVADGDYKIWIEMAWDNSKTTDKTVTSFAFTKGMMMFHLTPANTSLFTGISLDWVPSATGVSTLSQSKNVKVFPNPSQGIVNIEFKTLESDSQIQIANSVGDIVYEAKVAKGTSGVKTIDISKNANGIYLVNIIQANQADNLHYKIILNK